MVTTLVSPGASISVTDESFTSGSGAGTVPLIVFATAENKTAPDGSTTAAFTVPAEAGELKLITSQRELLANYGNPDFKTSGGTALHGHELNEYGLMAAYSYLGLSNRAYCLRADIDLGQLEASASAPSAAPADGTYWVDVSITDWGLKRWDGSSNVWVKQTVLAPASTSIESGPAPKAAYGIDGSYAAVYFDENGNTVADITLWEKVSGAWYQIGTAGWDTATSSADFQLAPHTAVPSVKSTSGALADGDLYLQTNSPNNGSVVYVKLYDATSGQFTTESVVGYEHSYEAFAAYEAESGPVVSDLWVDYSADDATINLKRHSGLTSLTAQSSVALADTEIPVTPHTNGTIAFSIVTNDRDVVNGAAGQIDVTFFGYDVSDPGGNLAVDEIVTAVQDALSAASTSLTEADDLVALNNAGKITIVNTAGHDIEFLPGNASGFSPANLNLDVSTPYSNFEDLSFTASATEVTGILADGTLWYDNVVSDDRIDLLYNNAGTWASYAGDVQVAASTPTVQSDGASALVAGDIWVSSADLENYPQVYKYSGSAWVLIDSTDQVSSAGILFDDFRQTATALLDSDAPNAALYPYDMLAWNKRASGGNVKQWDATNGWWEDYSGNKTDGAPYLLRKAQRRAVVRALQAAINASDDARNESFQFNLLAVPGYPELFDEMITLNTDRKETAFVLVDPPMRLSADSTSTQNWATNGSNAAENGEEGLLSSSPYAGVYYPHGFTSNLDGTNVVVPASHIALRTIAFNDQVSFPWFAPAGFQRGLVTNASSVGYIDSTSGEFVAVSLSEGQRDSLYLNKINPIGNFPSRGLAVFGQKTLNPVSSALDRVNVARLVVYIRERLDDIVKPFLFEPNDEVTRQNAKVVVDRFLSNIVTQRGLFDFVTVVDTSNNTPARIDNNELWIDIAIQPVKAVEFIYIPIRIQNTLGQTG